MGDRGNRLDGVDGGAAVSIASQGGAALYECKPDDRLAPVAPKSAGGTLWQ